MTDTKIEKTCGLVMPISSIDGYPAEHWSEVKAVISDAVEAISEYKMTVRLVSDADDVGVIQKRIVQNLYTSDIVVCDVSGKNPNVMFELGMRLAFDKPTVIIKDDKTDYSFDTGVIEHIAYRRDLRFGSVVSFKKNLVDKVVATMREAERDPNHSTFLKNFGTFNVASLKQAEVSTDKVVIEMLSDLQSEVAGLRRNNVGRISRVDADIRVRIREGLRKWCLEHDMSYTDAVGNPDLSKFIENLVDAPKIYTNHSDFQNAVDTELISLSLRSNRA
ncbi:hypothetical protein [Janthinobacterium tructae]